MSRQLKKRKTNEDRIPVPLDLLAVIREQSERTGIRQYRLVADLLRAEMRRRRWITDEPAEAQAA